MLVYHPNDTIWQINDGFIRDGESTYYTTAELAVATRDKHSATIVNSYFKGHCFPLSSGSLDLSA